MAERGAFKRREGGRWTKFSFVTWRENVVAVAGGLGCKAYGVKSGAQLPWLTSSARGYGDALPESDEDLAHPNKGPNVHDIHECRQVAIANVFVDKDNDAINDIKDSEKRVCYVKR